MKHRPDRIVVLVPELPLKLGCRYALLRAGQKVHGDEPVAEGQLGAVHDGSGPEALAMVTVLALEALLVGLPPIFGAAACRTHHTLLDAEFLPFVLAALFVWILAHKIYKFHTLPVLYAGANLRLKFDDFRQWVKY